MAILPKASTWLMLGLIAPVLRDAANEIIWTPSLDPAACTLAPEKWGLRMVRNGKTLQKVQVIARYYAISRGGSMKWMSGTGKQVDGEDLRELKGP